MAKKKSSTAKGKKSGEDEDVDFERVLAEVESIVGKLESGELNLTESLEQYERGIRQLKSCHLILNAAERRVTMLSGFDADGNPVTEPMPEADMGTLRGQDGEQSSLGGDCSTPPTMDDSPGLF